jgi:iron complex outermembrane receptor protein
MGFAAGRFTLPENSRLAGTEDDLLIVRDARHHLTIIVVLFLFTSGATAQNSAPTPSDDEAAIAPPVADETDATAETERVIVTGSNIPSAGEVGPNPVQIINRDFIEKSGEHTTEELLRQLPITGGSSTPISNNEAGRTAGASSVSLRGFGEAATLVLIDGRRVAPYPLGGGFGTDAFVDLSSIPLAATESIEVLKGGASTTYGADAVAGVVNIKFRRDYRGTESAVHYGNTLDKDNGESSASLFFGVGDAKTNVTGMLSYYRRNSIYNRDRGYSNRPIRLSTFSSPGNFEVSRDAVIAAGVSPDQLPDGDTFFASPPRFTNGNTPAADFIYTPGRSSRFNYNLFSNTFPDIERYGGLVTFRHKLCDEQLVIYGDVLYTNNKTQNDFAPAPTGNFQAAGFTTIAIPPHAPGPTLGGPGYAETGVPIGAFNPFNPFQQIISGLSRYRLADFPCEVGRMNLMRFSPRSG